MLSSEEVSGFEGLVAASCREHESDLQDIFEKKKDPIRYPLLLQPEAILVFYLLSKDEFALEERWPVRLADGDLRKFKTLWGVS